MDEHASGGRLVSLAIEGAWDWQQVLSGANRSRIEQAVGQVLPTRRWFGSKARELRGVEIVEAVPLGELARLLIVRTKFAAGEDEIYQLPLAYVPNGSQARINADSRWIVVEGPAGTIHGVLYDALGDAAFCQQLLGLFDDARPIIGGQGALEIERTEAFATARGTAGEALPARLVAAEQSNSSVIFGQRLIMKIFRRIETGLNPDFEISEFLTRVGFRGTPPLAGAITYRQDDKMWALALLQTFVPNRGDAWKFTLDWLQPALAEFLAGESHPMPALPASALVEAATRPLPAEVRAAFGGFLSSVEQLARRTGEMHLALASDTQDADFRPEEFSEEDRRSFLQRAGDYARQTWALLRERQSGLSGDVAEQARRVAGLEPKVHEFYSRLAVRPVRVQKIRIHGDYHLGQVLATGDDFAIIDFEGEPVRSIAKRRRKQLALRDVAGMIRSWHYASRTAAASALQGARDEQRPAIDAWTRSWYAWSSVAFLRSYRETVGEPGFLPSSLAEIQQLLDACLLEKAVYELRYELNNRPDWVYLPLAALEELLT